MNEKNIKPHEYQKGQSGNPNGRPPKLCNIIKKIPNDAQERVYATLYEAMTCSSKDESRKTIEASDWGEFGFIKAIAIKGLMGKNGWQVLSDIMDRLFGKAKQTMEQKVEIDSDTNPMTELAAAIRDYKNRSEKK